MDIRWKEVAVNLFLVLLTILIFFIALELALRFFFPREVWMGELEGGELARTSRYIQYDEVLGWKLIPGASARSVSSEYDVNITINSLGFRDPERTLEKPAGKMRIAVLGDSFVHGEQVELGQRLTDLLEARLNDTEVLNFGTSGYGTDQELMLYQRVVRNYTPDLVLLVTYIGNDLEDIVEYQKFMGNYKPRFVLLQNGSLNLTNVPVPPKQEVEYGGVRGFLAKNSYAYNYISDKVRRVEPLQNFLVSLGLRKPAPDIPFFRGLLDGTESEQEKEAWALEEALLAELKADVEADGSQLLVVILPSAGQVYDAWGAQDASIPNKRLEGILQQQGIGYVDLYEPMKAEASASTEKLYFPLDTHLTVKGNEVVAGFIYGELEAKLDKA